MKNPWVLCVLGVAAGAAFVGALAGCNGVLGIGAASLEPDEGGTSDGGTTEGGPVVRGLTCDYYCQTIVQNCTGPYAEYVGSEDAMALCQAMCPVLDQGTTNTIGPSNDDSLGCRIYYAEQAATDPATNCRNAGMLGGGVCGSDACQIFCELDVQYCATVNAVQYATVNDCISSCTGDAGFPYDVPPPGDAGCQGYDLLDCTNTVNCRFWHLQNAYGSSKNGLFHCPHTANPSPVCL